MYVMYDASLLWCWQLIRILIETNDPCLRVGCHRIPFHVEVPNNYFLKIKRKGI
jgi:hypothetical protein